jgi:hypothetical protein
MAPGARRGSIGGALLRRAGRRAEGASTPLSVITSSTAPSLDRQLVEAPPRFHTSTKSVDNFVQKLERVTRDYSCRRSFDILIKF